MLLLTSSGHLVTLPALPIRCLCVDFARITIFFTITIPRRRTDDELKRFAMPDEWRRLKRR